MLRVFVEKINSMPSVKDMGSFPKNGFQMKNALENLQCGVTEAYFFREGFCSRYDVSCGGLFMFFQRKIGKKVRLL
jgi:hypothetical protein